MFVSSDNPRSVLQAVPNYYARFDCHSQSRRTSSIIRPGESQMPYSTWIQHHIKLSALGMVQRPSPSECFSGPKLVGKGEGRYTFSHRSEPESSGKAVLSGGAGEP